MRGVGRCPRCGYTLTYDGRGYRCDFCGYPSSRRPLMVSLRNLERTLRFKGKSLLERGGREQYQRMIVQYPYAAREQLCVSCGLRIPSRVSNCPYCGATQVVAQASPQASVNTVAPGAGEQQVLDYITAHNGTISMSKAAHDLAMSPNALRFTIERLKAAGLLKPE